MGIQIGDVSPLAGMMTGKGALGDLMRKGLGGMIPQAIAKSAYEEREEEKKKTAGSMAPAGAPMKKGGKVSSASSRADGCAVKGKTRGKIV